MGGDSELKGSLALQYGPATLRTNHREPAFPTNQLRNSECHLQQRFSYTHHCHQHDRRHSDLPFFGPTQSPYRRTRHEKDDKTQHSCENEKINRLRTDIHSHGIVSQPFCVGLRVSNDRGGRGGAPKSEATRPASTQGQKDLQKQR